MKSLKVAVVGATGMVGRTILKALEQRAFPVEQLIPVASEKSVGSTLSFNGNQVEVESMKTALEMNAKVALFSVLFRILPTLEISVPDICSSASK